MLNNEIVLFFENGGMDDLIAQTLPGNNVTKFKCVLAMLTFAQLNVLNHLGLNIEPIFMLTEIHTALGLESESLSPVTLTLDFYDSIPRYISQFYQASRPLNPTENTEMWLIIDESVNSIELSMRMLRNVPLCYPENFILLEETLEASLLDLSIELSDTLGIHDLASLRHYLDTIFPNNEVNYPLTYYRGILITAFFIYVLYTGETHGILDYS